MDALTDAPTLPAAAVKPRRPAPALSVDTVDGGRWTLAERAPETFTLVVFYRGLHCPICKGYLGDLQSKLDAFAERGVDVVAVSTDDAGRARKARADWGLDRLTLGYGLSIDDARRWGLYVSRAIRDGEPAEFAEPGLFLIRPDGTVYAGSIQTMPFARPQFGDVLSALDFVVKNDYPARGEA